VATTGSSRYIYPSEVTDLILGCINGYTEEELCLQYHKKAGGAFNDIQKTIHQVLVSDRVSHVIRPTAEYTSPAHTVVFGERGCYYPQQIILELTNLCNLACSHCYKNATLASDSVFMDFSQIVNLLLFIGTNVPQIVLTGGEPLLHPYINDIIQLVREKDIIIKSNGTKLTDLSLKSLQAVRLFSISIYGLSDAEYLQRTGNATGFSDLVHGLQYIAAQHVTFELSVTLDKEKVHQMAAYAELAYKLGAKTLSFGRVSKEGRANNVSRSTDNWYLTQEETRAAYKEMRQLSAQYAGKLEILQWERPMVEQFAPKSIEISNRSTLFCGAGVFHWTVTENFEFKPCVTMGNSEFITISFDKWKQYVLGTYSIDWCSEINRLKSHILNSGRTLAEVCPRL
jgi:MoaA/NifB/PqqE/SkfB family radical SAM enzyme